MIPRKHNSPRNDERSPTKSGAIEDLVLGGRDNIDIKLLKERCVTAEMFGIMRANALSIIQSCLRHNREYFERCI